MIDINSEIKPLLTLQLVKGYGEKRIMKILEASDISLCYNHENLYRTLESLPFSLNIPSKSEIETLWKKAADLIKKSTDQGVRIISIYDEKYPTQLKKIENPPFLLHLKGNVGLLSEKSVAVVGTRKPCEFSKISAIAITKKLVNEGFCIVSGLAEGIDTVAHETTLKNNGNTIAVMAHGLHMIYPNKNDQLAKKIIKKDGLLVSEHPVGTTYNKGFFLARNRIQSGLSSSVYILETDIKGGTMKTAEFAVKQNRELHVLKPPKEFIDFQRYSGNMMLLDSKAAPFTNTKLNQKIRKENKQIRQQRLPDC